MPRGQHQRQPHFDAGAHLTRLGWHLHWCLGLAQGYARGVATVTGGGLLSLFGGVFGGQDTYGAYASVFVIQAVGLLLAGLLLLRVDTTLFQQRVQRALGDLLALELD